MNKEPQIMDLKENEREDKSHKGLAARVAKQFCTYMKQADNTEEKLSALVLVALEESAEIAATYYAHLSKRHASLEKDLESANDLLKNINEYDKWLMESDAIAASCGCHTKTNDHTYHKAGCKYRLICERNAAQTEAERLRARIKNELIPVRDQAIKQRDELAAIWADSGWVEQAAKEISEKLFPGHRHGDEENSAEGHKGESNQEIIEIILRHSPRCSFPSREYP